VITDWFTPNQWVVISLLSVLVLTIAWEILFASTLPWSARGEDDLPPVIAGMFAGIVTTLAGIALIYAIEGIVWMWNN
jgi:hypothetical protein